MRWLIPSFLGFCACGGTESIADGGDGSGVRDGQTIDAIDATAPTDAADEGSTTGDAAAFDIKSIPGLVLWLDGSMGLVQNAGHVTSWSDRSIQKNDAAQGNANFQPTFVMNGVGGLPCVHFDAAPQTGQVLVVADSSSLQFGTGDFLVEVVARYDNAPSATPTLQRASAAFFAKADFINNEQGVLFFGNTPAIQPVHTNLQAQLSVVWNATSSNEGYNDGKGRDLGMRRVGSMLELRAAGMAVGSSTYTKSAIDVSAAGIPLNLGSTGGQGYPDASLWRLDGDICEVIAVRGAISPSDLIGVEGYLATKYKL
jgi:hypothetical protein